MAKETPEIQVVEVARREALGSRAARRLRRAGLVPGVIYGPPQEAEPIQVGARELRALLADSATLFEVQVDGGERFPAVIKELQRDPVQGDPIHLDLMRVSLDRPIHAVVTLELVGAEDAPGVREGGVLEQMVRELSVEGLPAQIPAVISQDVSHLGIGDTLTVAEVQLPEGVRVLTETPGAVVATITPPRVPGAAPATEPPAEPGSDSEPQEE